MKKTYSRPTVKVVKLQHRPRLLVGSDGPTSTGPASYDDEFN